MTTLYLTEPGTVVRYRNQSLLVVKRQRVRTCRFRTTFSPQGDGN